MPRIKGLESAHLQVFVTLSRNGDGIRATRAFCSRPCAQAAGAGALIVPRTIAVPRVLAPTCPRCAGPYAPAMTVSHAG